MIKKKRHTGWLFFNTEPVGTKINGVPGWLCEIGEHTLFVHRPVHVDPKDPSRFIQPHANNWFVTEPATGARLLHIAYPTIDQALRASVERINHAGAERFASLVLTTYARTIASEHRVATLQRRTTDEHRND